MDNNKYVLTIDGKEYRFLEEQMIDNNNFHLEKLSYDKGIYHPAEMLVTMKIDGQGIKNDQLVNAFYMKDVKLTINNETVAENYFVFKVKPIFQRVSNVTGAKLELTIYSQDKLMTLDKYSKAWSGKKLGNKIFNDEIKGFTYNKKTISACSDLQVVDYGSDEFIQPYLVQYNESFYDFLRRTANRCGEFLYHENGMLHLGMKINDKSKDKDPDYAEIASERYYETILSEGTETTDYAYNYLPKDRSMPSKDDKPYSNPLTYDDYLDNVSETYTTWAEQMDFLSKNLANTFCMALEGTSLANIVSNLSVSTSFNMLHAMTASTNMNQKHKEANITPWAEKEKGDQKSGDAIRQFGTIYDQQPKNNFCGKKINMNAEFYALIREAEKKVGENAVYLEFGEDTQKLSIGDKIKVDGENYVVIGVNGSCEFTETSHLITTTVTYNERQQVIAVKLYGEAAIPPALPDIVIRESQPQLAFVTDNYDPEKIGRVRVRFAWQSDDGDASPWIRVSLPFATNGAGVKFKPETGDEVMISFEEGNIERPYVSGFLLSPRNNESWSWLPDRSITSKNGHTITFNDGIDGASFIYALSPFWKLVRSFLPNAVIPPALKEDDIARGLTGGMTISDRFGLYKINLSSDSRSVMIQSAVGNVNLSAFTGISISAPNGDIKIQGRNIQLEASDTVSIESGKAVKNRFFPWENSYGESGSFWDSTGGRWMADMGLTFLRDVTSRTINKIVDVQLLRTMVDTVLRPIDGTTKIKSLTFVRIEAGKGSAEYPRAARRTTDKESVPYDLYPSIDKIASIARSRVEAIETTFIQMCKDIEAFKGLSGNEGVNANQGVISVSSIKDASFQKVKRDLVINWPEMATEDELTNNFLDEYNNIKNEMPKRDDDPYKNDDDKFNKDLDKWQQKMNKRKEAYLKTLSKLTEMIKNRKKVEDAAKKLGDEMHTLYMASQVYFNSEDVDCDNLYFVKSIKAALKKMSFSTITIDDTTNKDSITDWAAKKKHHMRNAVCLFLSESDVTDKLNNYYLKVSVPQIVGANLADDVTWTAAILAMVSKPTTGDKIKVALKEWPAETYLDIDKDKLCNLNRWKVGVDGKILLSDNSGKTLSFDNNGVISSTDNMTFTNKSCDEMIQKLGNIGSLL